MIENKKGNKSGIGLGLFISKELSKKLSYKDNEGIRVNSVIKQGTIFTFLL